MQHSPPVTKRLYEFGPFRLDTQERILLRQGQYVPLTPKALDTLTVLLEQGGKIVDKGDLLRLIWPDTFVEEVSLAKNVSTLRRALGEDANHHYIETIPKRGYRFMADFRILEPATVALASPEPAGDVPEVLPVLAQPELQHFTGRPRAGNSWGWRAAFLALVASGLCIGVVVLRRPPNVPAPLLKAIPLTSYPGRENQVAFSPDGNQIAFTWDENLANTPHIYVKLIGSETPLRLTNTEFADSKPAWSPDGKAVVFLRTSAHGRAYYQIPALGGAERKLTDIFPYQDLGVGNSPYYSPDGTRVAIIDKESSAAPSSIFLLSTANLEKRKLTSPPPGATGDYYPAFSPDGSMLAFVRSSSLSTTDLYVLRLPEADPQRLTFDGLTIQGLTWTPNSREIIFSSRRGGSISYLWRIAATGGKPARVSTVGRDVISPAISSRGNRLAYTQSMDDMNIWRAAIDVKGRGTPGTPGTPVVASTFWDADPDYSPDGGKVAFSSGRSGGFGIWLCNADGANPRMLFDGGPYVTGTPRWSPDGRWIAFDSRSNDPVTGGNPDIYVIGADGGLPRRLTTDPAEDIAPSWSQDGRWVYFGSTRSGEMNIWKVPAEGGPATQVTRHGGFEAFESHDGKYLYYLKGRGTPGIWRIPAGGGEEVLATDRNQAGFWRYWRVTARGIFYATATTPSGPRIELFDPVTGHTSEIVRMSKGPDINVPGLAVSPDGRYLLYAQKDQSGSDIMMVEDFQ